MISIDDEKYLVDKFSKFGLNQKELELIVSKSKILEFDIGDVLYKNTKKGFMKVKEGILRAFILSQTSKEVTIFKLKKDDECILCSKCLNSNLQLKIDLEVKEKLVLLTIPPEIFVPLREKYPKLANFSLELISQRFMESLNSMQDALFTTLSEKIKNFLREHVIDGFVSCSHEEIANDIGSSRESVSRTLKEIEKKGEIKLLRKKIKIININ